MSDLVSITARLNAAKPGPWAIGAVGLMRDRERICAQTGSNGGYFGFIDAPRFDDDRPDVTRMTRPDAEFIAHAPSDIGYLLGRVAELEAQRDAVLALHRKQTRYGVVGWEEFSFDSKEDALDFVGVDDADFLPFDICAHCGDVETHRQDLDDDPRQFESSAWPCATVRAYGGTT